MSKCGRMSTKCELMLLLSAVLLCVFLPDDPPVADVDSCPGDADKGKEDRDKKKANSNKTRKDVCVGSKARERNLPGTVSKPADRDSPDIHKVSGCLRQKPSSSSTARGGKRVTDNHSPNRAPWVPAGSGKSAHVQARNARKRTPSVKVQPDDSGKGSHRKPQVPRVPLVAAPKEPVATKQTGVCRAQGCLAKHKGRVSSASSQGQSRSVKNSTPERRDSTKRKWSPRLSPIEEDVGRVSDAPEADAPEAPGADVLVPDNTSSIENLLLDMPRVKLFPVNLGPGHHIRYDLVGDTDDEEEEDDCLFGITDMGYDHYLEYGFRKDLDDDEAGCLLTPQIRLLPVNLGPGHHIRYDLVGEVYIEDYDVDVTEESCDGGLGSLVLGALKDAMVPEEEEKEEEREMVGETEGWQLGDVVFMALQEAML